MAKEETNCPIRKALQLFEGKWTVRVLYELLVGGGGAPLRFGQLRSSITSISNTMLTSTLKELEENGLVYRHQFNEIPPHVEYELSERGRALFPIFQAIGAWGEKYS